MAEVDLVALVLRVGACLAVVHLRRTGGLEYTGNVERKGALELASLSGSTDGFLLTCGGVQRIVGELVDVEAEQFAHCTVDAVDVVLLLEHLAGLQQVIDVVST